MAMHAGYTLLQYLQKNPSVYEALDRKTEAICSGIRDNLDSLSLNFTINRVGSMFTLFFNPGPVNDFDDAKRSDLQAFGKYFNKMLEQGIYPAPSQFEALFVSNALGDREIGRIVEANLNALKQR
jgi:glutamate-1-semialdehyde 2,1-aminomutase